MIDTGLKDKFVLLTGGNNPHGIGAATAKALALEGAAVFIHYFRQPVEVIDNLKEGSDFDTPGVPYTITTLPFYTSILLHGPDFAFIFSLQMNYNEVV